MAIYDRPTVNIIFCGEKLSISINIENKTRMSIFTTLIQYKFESLNHNNQKGEKKRKGIQFEKEKVKLSLYIYGMILTTYRIS